MSMPTIKGISLKRGEKEMPPEVIEAVLSRHQLRKISVEERDALRKAKEEKIAKRMGLEPVVNMDRTPQQPKKKPFKAHKRPKA